MIATLFGATLAATDLAPPPAIPSLDPAPIVENAVGADNTFTLLLHASPVVQFTFLVLVLMSVFSWAVVFSKWRAVNQVKRSEKRFWRAFERVKSLEDLFRRSSKGDNGPLFRLFQVAFSGLNIAKSPATGPQPTPSALLEQTRRELAAAKQDELDRLESYLPFLATTASTAPFVGLFGTVWGILNAFWEIGKMGSSSLAVVGPYIAEALVATAVGLATAIPAVAFYNLFLRQLQKIGQRMDSFTEDLIQRLRQGSNGI